MGGGQGEAQALSRSVFQPSFEVFDPALEFPDPLPDLIGRAGQAEFGPQLVHRDPELVDLAQDGLVPQVHLGVGRALEFEQILIDGTEEVVRRTDDVAHLGLEVDWLQG